MKKITLICGLILTATFIHSGLVFSVNTSKKDTAAEKKDTQIELQPEHSQSLAHKMMGHINLAKFALASKLPREATHHIEKAQIIKTQLASQLPEFKINSTFNYGKVIYADQHTIKEHYVPVVDDVLLISDYETIFENLKERGVKATNASVVHLGISIDLREVKKALDTALRDINHKKYDEAQNALAAIFKGAIIHEEKIEEPILSVAENLALAKAFLNNEQYNKAHLTLKYVQEHLNSTNGESLLPFDHDSAKKLSVEMNELQAELRRKDPTMTQSLHDRFNQWRKTVRKWFG
jgi:YfdX protein